MRTLLVILPLSFDLSPCVAQAREPIRVQAFNTQSAVEAFCIGVLRRLARLDELKPYPAFFAPRRQRSPAELRPIIQHDRFRQPCSLAIRSSTRRTRSPPSELSTSIVGSFISADRAARSDGKVRSLMTGKLQYDLREPQFEDHLQSDQTRVGMIVSLFSRLKKACDQDNGD